MLSTATTQSNLLLSKHDVAESDYFLTEINIVSILTFIYNWHVTVLSQLRDILEHKNNCLKLLKIML